MAGQYFWQYSINGATKQPMSGFNRVKRDIRSLQTSTVSLTEMLDDYADPTTFQWLNQISIFRNGVQWFYGWVTDIKRAGSPADHSVTYIISDPWYWLEKTVFCQTYRYIITAPSAVGPPAVPTMPSSGSFIAAGFTAAQITSLNLLSTIDSSSGHWYGSPATNPNDASTFLDSLGYYYYVSGSSHAYLNGFQRTNYLTYSQPVPGIYVRENTQQQIIEVLQWAQSVYQKNNNNSVPFVFQLSQTNVIHADGTETTTYSSTDITPAVDIASSEVKDQMCSEVIRNQLGVCPDCVTWFDYTQSPPELKIKQRGVNPAVKVVLYGGGVIPIAYKVVDEDSNQVISTLSNFKTSNVHPRPDLIAPVVTIRYEYVNTIQGKSYLQTVMDWWPNTSQLYQPNGLVTTLSMTGESKNGQTNDITVSALPAVTDTVWTIGESTGDQLFTFWQSQCDLFNDPNVLILGITMASRQPNITYGSDPGYVNYVASGQIASWMSVTSSKQNLTATVTYSINGGSQLLKNVSANVETTTLPTGVQSFYDSSGDTYAEPIPVGLAQAIWQSCQQLQYDGSVSFEEEECSYSVQVGNVLNIADPKQPAWSYMDAMIVSVSEDLDKGETNIEFGVTAHRGAADLVQILRALRTRVVIQNYEYPVGAPVAGGQNELGDILAVRDAQARSGYMANTGFYDPTVNGANPYSTGGGYTVPGFFVNVPALGSATFPDAYSGVPTPTAPSIIFADQTNTKIAIRLADLPAGQRFKLIPIALCDSITGVPTTTGYVFGPDTSTGYF